MFRKQWQRWKYPILIFFGLLLAFTFAACNGFQFSQPRAPLPRVEALPNPKLPDWIEQISPTQETTSLGQIRIRFKDPLIPVEQLDSKEQLALLKKFEVFPELPGQFRFLTPRMVGFQMDEAIPQATRVRVTLKAGLQDLQKHQLDQDLAWTFNTAPIKLSQLPGEPEKSSQTPRPMKLKPELEFVANTQLNLNALNEHLRLSPQNSKNSVPLEIKLKEDTLSSERKSPERDFNPDQTKWVYLLTPKRNLQKATGYQLKISSGLEPERGNLSSDKTITQHLKTYAPLAFEKTAYWGLPDASGAYGRFKKGAAQLTFNNGIDAESARKHIHVEPLPREDVTLVRAYDGDKLVSLNPWALEPATQYQVKIDADLKDTYGQRLGKPLSLEYETGDTAAALWAPSNLNIFPSGTDLQLNVSVVNLPDSSYQSAYRVVQPRDLIYLDSAYPRGKSTDLLPKPETWASEKASSPKNQSIDLEIPLQEKLRSETGMLAYGVKARAYQYSTKKEPKWYEPSYYGLVQLTNLGVFAQWFPRTGVVRVHHLSDGAAAGNVAVDVYQSKLGKTPQGSDSPCAQGTTDVSGTLTLNQAALRQCMGGANEFEDAPELLVVARENQDWAFVRTLSYSGYGYGADLGWNGTQPISRGTIFSDRKLYKPNETGWFTAEAYGLISGQLQQVKQTPFEVTLIAPNGEKKDLDTQTTNDFGTFSFPIKMSSDQPLGNYTLQAKAKNGLNIQGEFRVAEFKPPNFKVDLSLNKEFATPREIVEAKAQSNYLFGAPVGDAQVNYYVTRQPTRFKPEGWNNYAFGQRWFWPEKEPTISSDVLQVNATLNASGESQQTVQLPKDLPFPMTYRWDAEVKDVSNLSVAADQSFVALPSDRLIGLKSEFVADVGQSFPIEMIVTDPKGKTIPGVSVTVELQKMNYNSVTQLIEGSATSKEQVEYLTVDTVTQKSGKSATTIQLKPTEAGSYRIRANFTQSKTTATVTDTQIWATGGTPVYWGDRYSNERLELRLDQDKYKPGDQAKVLIQSPYPEAELYLAVVQHDTLYKTVKQVKGGAPEIQIPITADMLPNAVVEAVLVRKGQPLSQVEPGKVEDLIRFGFAPFELNLADQTLQVDLKPQAPSLQPQQEQTVSLSLKDAQGKPTKGQFTVMVVNESVLQLTDYRPPNLLDTVYAKQDISTRFADSRRDVVLEPLTSPLQKGWGYGGGFSAGAGSTRIRKDFKALAYFKGSVVTDSRGQAQVNFKLPDDLTTWRIMAVATDEQLRFGAADTTFIATKPLITNPVLPQFARPGDRFLAGLSVTSTPKTQGKVSINGTLKEGLAFEEKDQRVSDQQIQPKQTVATSAYRFPMTATKPGTAEVQFTSQLGNEQDGFQFPLEIRPHSVTEQVIETGTTTNQAKIPVKIAPTIDPDTGGLEISLSSTLIPELMAPVDQLERETKLPFLEPAASQLAIAASLQQLSQTYEQSFPDFNAQEQAAEALERLKELQNPDGGFASWPGQKQSDPIISPYAASRLAQAKAAGFEVNPAMVESLKKYLSARITEPSQNDFCSSDLCKNQIRLASLMGLADLGDRRNTFVSDIYQQREQYDFVTQLQLARYLSTLPDWKTEADQFTEKLQSQLYETGRTTKVNLPQRWFWCRSPELAQAEALQLMIERQQPQERLDRVVEGLLAQRRQGTWGSTYANAHALNALVNYSSLQPTPPSFSGTATLANQTILQQQFEGYRKTTASKTVPQSQLPQGQNDLVLKKSGEGTLHYLAALRYRLMGEQPGRMNGLRIIRTIRPANQENPLQTIDLSVPDQPLTVKVGEVFDIGLEIITDHPIDHAVITDPLPAGFEAVDTTFQTATSYFKGRGDSWQLSYQTLYKDKVVGYGDRLNAGVYTLHYLVRSVTPGTFEWPGAEVQLKYSPEEFGRSASSKLTTKSET